MSTCAIKEVHLSLSVDLCPLVSMETLRGKQENSSVFHLNGFYFHRNKSVNGTDYYRCIEWKRGCPAKGNVHMDGIFNQMYQHNHNADFNRATYMIERQGLIDEARRLDVATVRDVFRDDRRLGTDHPNKAAVQATGISIDRSFFT